MAYSERKLRKSGYGDYFAIDLVEGNKVIETPMYLRKGEEKPIKIRWDFDVFNDSGRHPQNCMLEGFIRFDGAKVEVCYSPSELQSSGGKKDWFEPTEYELTNKSIIHLKVPLSKHSPQQPL